MNAKSCRHHLTFNCEIVVAPLRSTAGKSIRRVLRLAFRSRLCFALKLVNECRRLTQPLKPLFGDRKSTRLNSSHLGISYAVFCLKKKKKKKTTRSTEHTSATPEHGSDRTTTHT